MLGLGDFRKPACQRCFNARFRIARRHDPMNQRPTPTRIGLLIIILALTATIPLCAQAGHSKVADVASGCKLLPTQGELKAALASARGVANGGFNLDMWATVVNRDGVVCAVAFSGSDRGSQW